MDRRKFVTISLLSLPAFIGSTSWRMSGMSGKAFVVKSGLSRFGVPTPFMGVNPNDLKLSSKDTTGKLSAFEYIGTQKTGPSLHEDIDRGQIIGAFVQAMGWCTMEDIPHDAKGKYLALSPSTYKIPGIRDLPDNLVVEMVQSPCKEASVLGSKAVGEPPFIYGEAVWFAIRNAIAAVSDRKIIPKLKFPATPEAILMAIEAIKNNTL